MNEQLERPPFRKWLAYHVLPALAGALLAIVLIVIVVRLLQKEPERKEPQRILPNVEVALATPTTATIEIPSQGTVEARTETQLVAEVSGRVIAVSPALSVGGFFKAGETLARIDPSDYEANLAAARSRQAEAFLAYEQEKALAAQAKEDWATIAETQEPSPLTLREPQLKRALANLEAAEASLRIAQRDLERTTVKAPYDGRARAKYIDVGHTLNARTSRIADIYATDAAEIRLPISASEFRILGIDESYRDVPSDEAAPKAEVIISLSEGSHSYEWRGRIARSEGFVDPRTRLLNLVARIDDPYQRSEHLQRPPLKIGSFVTARIIGPQLDKVFELPRAAVREHDTLYVIDPHNRLEIRPVSIVIKDATKAIVSEGLAAGERICLTPLQYAVEGMEVVVSTPGS